ncbi:MAG: DNA-binding protein [Hyphomicrobiaceae bacterium]
MASFDFDAAVRWARLDPRRTLARRADAELPFASEEHVAGQALLLDTCVYIDKLQGRSPGIVESLTATRPVNHSTVAIQELLHTVGVLDPDDRRTAGAVAETRGLVRSVPPHRIFAPDVDVLGRAALLSGIVCRLQGYAADRKLRALHDCVLLLHAQKLGFTLLTANVADFDILLQLLPSVRILLYRRK